MNYELKKAALINDLSGYGRCSLAVMLPVISAAGVQGVCMPTALLSTHTGGYEGYSYYDAGPQLEGFIKHYEELGIKFDAVFTGYLGGPGQFGPVGEFLARQKDMGALIIVDPVLGDDGAAYSGIGEDMRLGMRELAARADFVTPNMTEAFFLADMPYLPPPYDMKTAERLMEGILTLGARSAAITGLSLDDGRYGVMYAGKGINPGFIEVKRFSTDYPGTGDVFCAVTGARMMGGASVPAAVTEAASFLSKVIQYTVKAGTPPREGLLFEKFLGEICK